jgi:hypothetical protein
MIDNTDRAFRAYIQIVLRQVGTMMIEGLAILDAEIAAMTIPKGRQPLERQWHVASSSHDHRHVDDRLGGSPGTEVLPTCSMPIATSETTGQIRARSSSNRRGHSSS